VSLPNWGSEPLGPIKLETASDALSGSTLALLLEGVPVSLAVMIGPDHRYVLANGLYRSSVGKDTSILGSKAGEVLPPSLSATWLPLLDEVLSSGHPAERTTVALPETGRWWHIKLFPLSDKSGALIGTLWLGLDATAEVRARDEASQQAGEARRHHDRLELAIEATELGMWEWDLESGEVFWSDRQKAIFGLGPDVQPSYEVWRDSLHPDDRERVIAEVGKLLHPSSGGLLQFEHRLVQPTGDVRWISARGRMIYRTSKGGQVPIRLLGSVLDVTARKTGEEARQLLLREMNHRVKNLFAMAAGIVTASARTAADPRAMSEAVVGRLSALAASHDLIHPLVDGAEPKERVPLANLVDAAVRPFMTAENQVEVEGPALMVEPATASSLALVFHELATNAAKYGALRDGTLRIEWRRGHKDIDVLWSEATRCPTEERGRPGFGTLLLRRTVETGLGGQLTREWSSRGLIVRFTIPLERLTPP
jgi:PAS domain S-box-containing protein